MMDYSLGFSGLCVSVILVLWIVFSVSCSTCGGGGDGYDDDRLLLVSCFCVSVFKDLLFHV